MGKIPPQDIEVEEAVLGALMLESDAINEVSGIITAESFYKHSHQVVFEAILGMAKYQQPIDLITVTKELRKLSKLEEIGGAMAITSMTSRIASAANIQHYARIIQQHYIKRKIITISSGITSKSFDDNTDIEEIIGDIRLGLSEIENMGISAQSGKHQTQVIDETCIEMEADCAKYEKGVAAGITTGFTLLDEALGGWRNTNLAIVASRPGVGKTSLALFFAKQAALSGKWVNFYGLEMKSTDLMRIVISGQSNVNRTDIRDGRLSERDWTEINKSIARIDKLPIIWNDFAGITTNHIQALTAKNRKSGKCDMVIIDYLGLITPSNSKQVREQQIAEMSRQLKVMALAENIPVIVLSQLNREAVNDQPQLHHLRESGAIEQDADVVIFPWRKDDVYNLIVAKNRRGKLGLFEIYANEEMTNFGNKGYSENYSSNSYIEQNAF